MRGQNATEIKMLVDKGGEEHTIEVYLESRDKIYANFKIDGVKKKRKEAQGFVQVVIFDPTDVDLFTKSPDARRKYLNMVLSQKSVEYLDWLASYKKILFQKNKLLQDARSGRGELAGLDSWNEQLVEIGSNIIFERRKFTNFLNQSISEVYTSISQFQRPVEVFYESIPGESLEEIKEAFSLSLSLSFCCISKTESLCLAFFNSSLEGEGSIKILRENGNEEVSSRKKIYGLK
jgi:recombinational DNA repair ATPase RecF